MPGASKKNDDAMKALTAVVQHNEAAELVRLRERNAMLESKANELRMLQAIQMPGALETDIFAWFDMINDTNNTDVTIESLFELRDYIVSRTIEIVTGSIFNPETNRADSCIFSTVGGHYDLCGSIVMACHRYEQAKAAKEAAAGEADGGADADTNLVPAPEDWQWSRTDIPAHLCHNQCLKIDHMHVEAVSVVVTRYSWISDFPTHMVETHLKRQRQQNTNNNNED